MTYSATIPMAPIGKGRHRCVCIGGQPRAVKPDETRQWEQDAAMVIKAHMRGADISGPCALTIVAYWPRPKRRPSDVDPEVWASGEAFWRPSTPDADNVAKAVMDSLNAAGVWSDDCVVCRLDVRKLYAAKGQRARVVVELEQL